MLDLTPYLSSDLVDIDAIRALVSGERPGTVQDGYVKLLHRNLTPWVLAHGPNPDDSSDVTEWVTAASLDSTTARDVTTQVDLVLDSHIGDEVNMLVAYLLFYTNYYDALQPDADGNPKLLASFPRATVGFQIPEESVDDQGGGTTYKVTGYDKLWEIRDLYLQNQFVSPAGVPATQVVLAFLQMDNDTPSEGGRAPAGHATIGGYPLMGTGDNPYSSYGVFAHTVATTTDVNGYLVDPLGRWIYNPDASIMVDPVTHYPIDPWTCSPMSLPLTPAGVPDARYPNTAVASNGLWFNTHTGAFYVAGYPGGFETRPWDPFKNTGLSTAVEYFHPAVSVPTDTAGNVPCPLESWPHDWDGSGPYATTGGTQQVVTPGGWVLHSGSSLDTDRFAFLATIEGGGTTFASRFGTGTKDLALAGTYVLQPPVCATDPDHPSTTWCQPSGAPYWAFDAEILSQYIFPTGTWTVGVTLNGAPLPVGTMHLSAMIYTVDPMGVRALVGSLSSGTAQSFGGGANSLTLTCSGSVTGFAVGSEDALELLRMSRIAVEFALTCETDITCAMGSSFSHATIVASSAHAVYPMPSWSRYEWVPGNTTGGNTGTTPIYSGTNIPWPDANNPGLLPSGCETSGPNINIGLIDVEHSPVPAPVTTPYGRDTNVLAMLNTFMEAVAWRPLYATALGRIQIKPKPLFSLGLPDPVWNFRSDVYQVIKPPLTRKLADQTGMFNKVVGVLSNNNLDPVILLGKNESADSSISRANLGYWVYGKPIQNDQVPDEATLRLVITQAIQDAAAGMEAVIFTCADVPFLELYDPIEIYVLSVDDDVVVASGPFPYFIQAIQVDLMDPTSMQITCGRAIPV